ncbi:hypothetical protein EC973_005827 [Apophysomyces ossiformis]|uniref:F-box domain-containing protein n=1 Tax=Apophysomyces ossiformis TaxID=679940 RepID=A0A8H7BRT8_9FUNG|nr:hypothetical protein EC973_005827 [Apophysomyces ossiformis]
MDRLSQTAAVMVLSECTNKKLPTEILADIATRLPRRKLRTVVCVYRSWNAAITPELYRNIDIKAPHKQLDQLVRQLRMPENMTTYKTPAGITLPITLFPLIVEITTPVVNSKKMYLNFREWKHLRTIYVNCKTKMPKNLPPTFVGDHITKFSVTTDDLINWLGVFALLPGIEELEINKNFCVEDWSYRWVLSNEVMDQEKDEDDDMTYEHKDSSYEYQDQDITYKDLERLHQWLPRLRRLYLGYIEPYDDNPLSDHIVPCDTVRELTIGPQGPGSWGEYFARKYSHLKKLTILRSLSGCKGFQSDMKAILRSCAHLKRLRTAFYEDYNDYIKK